MKFKITFSFIIVVSFLALTVYAKEPEENSISQVINAYRLYKDIGTIPIKVPTVVELPITDTFIERNDIVVLDTTINSFEPYLFTQEFNDFRPSVSADTDPKIKNPGSMVDNDAETYSEFAVPENGSGHVRIKLETPILFTSSAVTILLDNNVALPSSVEIRAQVNGQDKIVVAKRKLEENTIRFPKTTSDSWTLSFTFEQPLRISELRLIQENGTQNNPRAIRWLAQPTHSYQIYFDPDRRTNPSVGEAGDLADATDVKNIPGVVSKKNLKFIMADVDGDGVPDIHDNCVTISNPDQLDKNNNGKGDACDDFDKDGIVNSRDNCPNIPNVNQTDTDGDGIGDVCDSEESRITERHTWIPWVGIGFAGLVLITLLALTASSLRKEK